MAISSINPCSKCGIETQKLNNNPNSEQQKEVQKLRQRDMEVRAHEAAHLAVAGQYATGGASFQYVKGPDGQRYAVGGEVKIDTSPVKNDPQATVQKAKQIRSAALAPANPSGADRAIAAQATKMEMEAQIELAQKKSEETSGYDKNGNKEKPQLDPVILILLFEC